MVAGPRLMGIFWDAIGQAAGLLISPSGYVRGVIAVTLSVNGLAVLVALVLGIPFGIWLGLTHNRARGLLAVIVNTGLFLPPVVVGLFVVMSLSRSGPLGSLGLLYSRSAIVIAEVLLAMPYVTAITMVAIGAVPRELRLQALGLGASRTQALWQVMRDARLALMAAVLAGLGSIMSEVGAAMMVGGNIATTSGNDTRTLTTAIVQETRMGNYATAMAFSLILMSIVFVIVVILTRAQQGRQGRWLRS